jgi:hypothetical protein
MRFVNGLIVALCAVQAVSAQPGSIGTQEIERARQMLNSPQWVTKAWGAYFAGRLHSDELQQALIEQFSHAALLRDSPYYSQEHAFVTVLFDAAIEAGVTIPATMLEPFEEGWIDPVLILLARDEHSEDPLLRLRREESPNIVWLAANNLLFERKSQRWYEALLGEIGFAHRFVVTDPDRGAGFGGGVGGGVTACGVSTMPKGFPPVTLYTLRDYGVKGDVLLAQGPRSVYYERAVVPTDRQVGHSSRSSILDRMEIRIGYLAELGHKSVAETDRLFRPATYIQYTSVEDFRREVERSITAHEQGIRELIQAIERDGLRAPDIRPRIVPEVHDTRRNATEPLPAVPERDFGLR